MILHFYVRFYTYNLSFISIWSQCLRSSLNVRNLLLRNLMIVFPPFQIRNWFQNRRMKLKRTVQDALAHACQANVASQFMHYPELQTYRPGPYPRYQEAPAAASYVNPHNLQYNSPLPGVSTLPLDSFYQYSSLPGVMLPSATTPLMGSYPTYPQYY